MNPKPETAPERIHYMDAMRGVLMALGVVYHSALVFSHEKRWLVYSDLSGFRADDFAAGLHLFRMPAFFAIAGYFATITLRRYGARKFFKVRLTRIAVPLLVTALTVNSLQALLLVSTGWRSYSLMQYLQHGEWVSHLWFLINLLVYFAAAACVGTWCPEVFTRCGRVARDIFLYAPILSLVLLLPLSAILMKTVGHFGVPIYDVWWGFVDVFSLLEYLPFFVFGALLASDRALPRRTSSISIFVSLALVIVAVWGRDYSETRGGLAFGISRTWLESVARWCSVAFCFAVFTRFANRRSLVFLWLSDASYSIYLFHQVLVVAFGLLLIQLGVGGWVGILLLITVVAACSALIHQYLIRPIPVMRYLFNGKTPQTPDHGILARSES